MFTHKDIEHRTIFVINCIEDRNLRVSNGELLLEENTESGKMKTLTKMPFQKILALFVIGHITITTPLIDKCKKFNVALVVMKPNLRPVFYWSSSAEANFLLRKCQFNYPNTDISIARHIIYNKIENHIKLLQNTRRTDVSTQNAIEACIYCRDSLSHTTTYKEILGIEGQAAKMFFEVYYEQIGWSSRLPRTKVDEINVTLDIGYTILFNFIECYLRMFGFDIYIGVYHRLWFKRKSLVCDIMEPFRCLIDRTVRSSFHKKHFMKNHFHRIKGEYFLKNEFTMEYYRTFYDALIEYKIEIFKYVQSYYRCFMQGKPVEQYPKFQI